MLPFPVSLRLGARRKKRCRASAPSGARARPGPRAAVMVTASARRLGCGPPGPGPPGPPRLGLSRCPSPSDSGFVLDSFRFKLLKYYSTVTVTGTQWLRLGLGLGVTVTGRLGSELEVYSRPPGCVCCGATLVCLGPAVFGIGGAVWEKRAPAVPYRRGRSVPWYRSTSLYRTAVGAVVGRELT